MPKGPQGQIIRAAAPEAAGLLLGGLPWLPLVLCAAVLGLILGYFDTRRRDDA